MLLYSTRTAVFKNGDKSVLLCKITLPVGAEDEEINARISEFYSQIYDATYRLAKDYAARILSPDGRLVTLTVRCSDSVKKDRLIVKRTYTTSHRSGVSREKTFMDKFKIKCDKTKKYSIKEQ